MMKKNLFEELVSSLREAQAIMRGEAKPARAFRVDLTEHEVIIRAVPSGEVLVTFPRTLFPPLP